MRWDLFEVTGGFVPCKMTFGPSPDRWNAGRWLLWPLLTSQSTECVAASAPPFGQALLAGTRLRSPQIRVVICPRPSSTSTSAPSSGLAFAVSSLLTWSRRPRMWFLFVTWRVLARRCPAAFLQPAYRIIFAGFLSTVCHLAAVALASYCLSLESFIWYTDSSKETGTKYRGLSPHKITPMLGVHRDRGPVTRDPSHTTSACGSALGGSPFRSKLAPSLFKCE